MSDMTELRAQLVAQLAQQSDHVDALEAQLREPLEADSGEQAVNLEDDEALEGVEAVALDQIGALKAAIARIDAGLYGECVSCGEAIAPARLEAQPTAVKCLACAQAG